MSLVLSQKERCGAWAMARIPAAALVGSWGDFEAIGWEKNGELQAVAIFNNFTGCDISMHIAAVPGKAWLRKAFLYAVFAYPFVQLKCRRISGYVPAKSVDVIAFDEHVGFKHEGRLRHALPDDDIVLLGLLAEDCRFIHRSIAYRKAA